MEEAEAVDSVADSPSVTDLAEDLQSKPPENPLEESYQELMPILDDYACKLCDNVFISPMQLAKHMQFHDRDRPFPCTICDKRFMTRSHFDEHQRVHTGERPYPCNHCDRSFTTQHNRKRHQFIHNKKKAYRCVVCKKLNCQKHQLNDIKHTLRQQDVVEPEILLEPKTNVKIEQESENESEPGPSKRGRVSDEDQSAEYEHYSGMSMHPDGILVYNGTADFPNTMHGTTYTIRKVAYDIEVIL